MPLHLRALAKVILVALTACPPARAVVTVRSPHSRAAVVVSFSPAGTPLWSVSWRGKAVLDPAPIGLRFVGRPEPALQVMRVVRRSHDSVDTGLLGKASTARNRYNEAVLTLSGGAEALELAVRAYDDGVAFRWQFRALEIWLTVCIRVWEPCRNKAE